MTIEYRHATLHDIDALYELIDHYAERGIMLPRSKKTLELDIHNFAVADQAGVLVGCGSLCRLGSDLAEIRSLGVLEACKGQGIGRRLVEMLTEEARRRNIPKLMALTYETGFFLRCGFKIVSKDIFPEKVWKDCVFCPKQNCCDEIAVLKYLD